MCYTPPVHRTLRYPEVVKHRKIAYEFFWHWETKYFWQKSVISHLFCIKFFWCPKLHGTPVGLPDVYIDSVRQKILISHLSCIHFSDAQSFLEHWWVRLINISVQWDKKFWLENRVIPPLMRKFFWCPKHFGTPLGWPNIYFSSVRRKTSRECRDLPLLWINFFDMSEFSWTLNGSSKNFLSTASQKDLTEKCVIPLPCTELSDTRK